MSAALYYTAASLAPTPTALPHRLLHAQYLNLADRHIRQHALYNPLIKFSDREFRAAWKLFIRSTQEVNETLATTIQQIDASTPSIPNARLKVDALRATRLLMDVDEFIPCPKAATAAVAGLLSLLTAHPLQARRG